MAGSGTLQVKHKRREMIHAELNRWKEASIEVAKCEAGGIETPTERQAFVKHRHNQDAHWARAVAYIDVELGI